MQIFISHSVKDREIAIQLSGFLESLSNDIEVFCSSDSGAIPVGNDFIRTITTQLKKCDTFLPLLSENYFHSKFCMIELGFAYSQLQSLNDDKKQQYIYPLCIPPLQTSALSGTPLGNIEVANVDDMEAYRIILANIHNFHTGQNKRIREFVADLHRCLIKRLNIFSKAQVIACCSSNAVMKDEKDFSSYSSMGSETTFNFNLDPYETGGILPNSVSLVFKFVDLADFKQFLALNENSCVSFEIVSFTNSLSKIDVEFKFSDNNRILKVFHLPIHYGENQFSVPLIDMQSEALSNVSEICFVVHPGDTVEIEGMVKICNMRVSTDN